MDVRTLLALAQNAADVGNVRAACEFYDVALVQHPNDHDVLEAYAELLIHQSSDLPRARQLLQHAIAADPARGHVKYLNLAQLSEADEALACYDRAAAVLRAELSACRSRGRRRALAGLRATLAAVHCAVAELFLTDLCFAADAEAKCEAAVAAALAAHAECVEAHQLLGSLRISQQRQEEALAALRRAVALSHRLGEAQQPTYESKVELGRLLMQTAPDEAFAFLLEVLQLGDNNPYVWFLLGEAARMRGRHADAARLLRRARVMLALAAEGGGEDEGNEQALREVDTAISVLVAEMGGEEAVQAVEDLDHPDPIGLLAPEPDEIGVNEEGGEEEGEEDEEEPEWELCEEDDEAVENTD